MVEAAVLGPIETDRLSLRPQAPEDGPVFHQLWRERDHRVPPHRRLDADGRPTSEDIAADIVAAGPYRSGPRLLTVVLKLTGNVIGYCGLNACGNASVAEPELAYELVRKAHGHGYGTEAAGAVVSWAADAGYPRLWTSVWNWNIASRRVLEKLGFREVGQVEPTSVHGHSLLTVLEL